jgi:hypothetical protein
MAYELARLRQRWPLQAWEMGPCAGQFPGLPQASQWAMPEVAAAERPPSSAGTVADASAGPGRGTLRGVKRKSGPPPGAADEAERKAAADKWCSILTTLASYGAMPGKFRRKEADLYVAECAAIKATQTLHLRAGSWLLYLAWAKSRGCDPYPMVAGVVEEYLRHAAGIAATRGSRFLEAVAFAQYTFGVEADEAFSSRARGIAALGLKKKKAIRQSAPFTVALVSQWEAETVAAAKNPQGTDMVRAICKGHFLWLVHTRSRFGDSARVKIEPWLDLYLDEEAAKRGFGKGYIETYAVAGEYKTGHSLKKVGRRFPMVGWATGVTGVPWAAAWLKLREIAGCDAVDDKTLMPEVLSNGVFGEARMTTQDGTLVLRELLRESGVADVEAYGTHSSKATLLSWAAKAGLSSTDRKLLGGHSESKDKSMEEYSRDVLAKPLLALVNLLKDIQAGKFNPDATRSGRWLPTSTVSAAAASAATEHDDVDDPYLRASDDEAASGGEDDIVAETSGGGAAAGGGEGGDASSDTTEKEESAEEAEVEVASRFVGGACGEYPEMLPGGIWLGSARGCIHRGLGADTPHAACGYGLKWITARWTSEWPSGVHPLCKRSSCFGLAK